MLFFVVFYELLFGCLLGQSNPLAELQEQSLLRRLLKRPTTAAHQNLRMSQLPVPRLRDVQRALPEVQVISALCFSKAAFDFPLKTDWTNACFGSRSQWASEGFPRSGFTRGEFGGNGPPRSAVAKKPWLAAVMSFCSLASASPMETLPFPPRCLVQRRVRSARGSAPQRLWQREAGSRCPLFANRLTSWFLTSRPLPVPAACDVFAACD